LLPPPRATLFPYTTLFRSLTDPISKWIPSFENVRVYKAGAGTSMVTVPAVEPIRVWHLLSHSSGLTAGFLYNHVVDGLYRAAGRSEEHTSELQSQSNLVCR